MIVIYYSHLWYGHITYIYSITIIYGLWWLGVSYGCHHFDAWPGNGYLGQSGVTVQAVAVSNNPNKMTIDDDDDDDDDDERSNNIYYNKT